MIVVYSIHNVRLPVDIVEQSKDLHSMQYYYTIQQLEPNVHNLKNSEINFILIICNQIFLFINFNNLNKTFK